LGQNPTHFPLLVLVQVSPNLLLIPLSLQEFHNLLPILTTNKLVVKFIIVNIQILLMIKKDENSRKDITKSNEGKVISEF